MTAADFAHCGNLDDHSNLETIDAHVKMDGEVKKEPVQNKLDLSVNKAGLQIYLRPWVSTQDS